MLAVLNEVYIYIYKLRVDKDIKGLDLKGWN